MLLVLIGIGVPAIVFAVSVWGRNLFCPAAIVGAGYFCRFDRDQPETLPKSWGRAAAWIAAWTAASLPEAFPHNTNLNGGTSQQIDQQYGPLSVAVRTNGLNGRLRFICAREKSCAGTTSQAKRRSVFICLSPRKCAGIETRIISPAELVETALGTFERQGPRNYSA